MKTTLLPLALLTGCYGGGTAPGTPSDITVLMLANDPATSDGCNHQQYLASAALLASDGHALTMPYQPNGNCNNGGGQADGNGFVYQFDEEAMTPASQTGMFTTSGTAPHAHVTRSGHYVWVDPMSNGTITLGPGTIRLPMVGGVGGALATAGVVDDGSQIFVAGVFSTSASNEVENPNFPCCGNQAASVGGGYFVRVAEDGTGASVLPISTTIWPAFDLVKESLAGNTDALFVLGLDASAGTNATVWRFPKAGTSASEVTKVDATPLAANQVAVGFAADDAHVAWSISNDFRTGASPHVCQVFSRDLATNVTTKLLDTTSFSCLDLALDASSVYFTIVDLETPPDQGSGTQVMHGLGLGRAGFDGSIATLDMQVSGIGRGARRILVDAQDIIAMDPDVLVRIPKTAVDSPLDFAP